MEDKDKILNEDNTNTVENVNQKIQDETFNSKTEVKTIDGLSLENDIKTNDDSLLENSNTIPFSTLITDGSKDDETNSPPLFKNAADDHEQFLNSDHKYAEPKKPKNNILTYFMVMILAFTFGFFGDLTANMVFNEDVTLYQSTNTELIANENSAGLNMQELAAHNLKSVVEIMTETNSFSLFSDETVQQGAGSGVILTTDGYIVTNYHVIEDSTSINVKLSNGDEYSATVVGTDEKTDLAVIKIEETNLTPAVLGDSDNLFVGDEVIAIGNPLGSLGGSVTDGIISGTNREILIDNENMNLLQTNAQVNPGNSGGGLFNARGELVGIVVAKPSDSSVEGIGFAIPANLVKDVVEDIIEFGYYTNRPTIGIMLTSIPEGFDVVPGVFITEVLEDSPALEAGLEAGDQIIKFNDVDIMTYTQLSDELKKHQVGDVVEIQVIRDDKTLTYDVKLGMSTNQ